MTMWNMKTVVEVANYDYTVSIDLDEVKDMSTVIDAYLKRIREQIPEATGLTRRHVEVDATRDPIYRRVNVVVRWNHTTRAVLIPSKREVFVPAWPVGLAGRREFKLPVQPHVRDMFSEFGTKKVEELIPQHETYELGGYDPENNAWVYDVVRTRPYGHMGATMRDRYWKNRRTPMQIIDEEIVKSAAEMREQLGLPSLEEKSYSTDVSSAVDPIGSLHAAMVEDETLYRQVRRYMDTGKTFFWKNNYYPKADLERVFNFKKSLKDLPVRESGLGIW